MSLRDGTERPDSNDVKRNSKSIQAPNGVYTISSYDDRIQDSTTNNETSNYVNIPDKEIP